jgi:hypothetical protein
MIILAPSRALHRGPPAHNDGIIKNVSYCCDSISAVFGDNLLE